MHAAEQELHVRQLLHHPCDLREGEVEDRQPGLSSVRRLSAAALVPLAVLAALPIDACGGSAPNSRGNERPPVVSRAPSPLAAPLEVGGAAADPGVGDSLPATASAASPTDEPRDHLGKVSRPPDKTEAWSPPGPLCRSNADCHRGEECFPPGYQHESGLERAPPAACDGDRECGAGAWCRHGECTPRCTNNASCGETETCQGGKCLEIECRHADGRGACPTNFTCAPSNGCVRDSCARDHDCEKGVCFAGRCYATLGGCANHQYCCPP